MVNYLTVDTPLRIVTTARGSPWHQSQEFTACWPLVETAPFAADHKKPLKLLLQTLKLFWASNVQYDVLRECKHAVIEYTCRSWDDVSLLSRQLSSYRSHWIRWWPFIANQLMLLHRRRLKLLQVRSHLCSTVDPCQLRWADDYTLVKPPRRSVEQAEGLWRPRCGIC